MATKKPQVKSYINEKTKEKLEIICKKENRSTSNQIEHIIETYIDEYEIKNGNITTQSNGIIQNQTNIKSINHNGDGNININ